MRKPKRIQNWDFDKTSKRYDALVKEAERADDWMYRKYEEVLDQVVAFAKDLLMAPQLTVVDIGIGTGNLTQRFVGKGRRVIGIDPSSEMLKVARKKFPGIELKKGDFLQLPVENGVVDLVVSSYAFHHLTEEEKMKAIEEMIRVLKDSGRIIIADLMFANREAEKVIKSKLIAEGKSGIVTEVEEEYYGYVNIIMKKFEALGFSTRAKQITDFVWVICATK